jgi:hypothetical protein
MVVGQQFIVIGSGPGYVARAEAFRIALWGIRELVLCEVALRR